MFLFEVVLLAFLLGCNALPNGAPKSACSSLTPVHHGISAQRTQPAYTVTAVKNGDKIRVKIASPVGEEFQGFVLQAREATYRSRIADGTFTVVNGVSKTIDCFKGTQNTLTHVTASAKREILTDFKPSSGVSGDIIFRATVAKTFALFYTEIDSATYKLGGVPGTHTSGRLGEESDSMYLNCFVTKGCFGLPTGCMNRRDCEVFLSYAAAPDGIVFNLHGFLEQSAYMAMGLSTDSRMGEDLVTECIRDTSNYIRARQSYNSGKSNGQNREFERNRYTGEFMNGMSKCTWTSSYVTDFNGRRFNLANSTYYLLLATGPMRNEFLDYHVTRISSQEAVNFTAFEEIESEGVTDSIKIHGTFMVTAWIGLVSIGIILARHFKSSWESSTLCGVKIWFACHRALMFTALIFAGVAFIVIFVHKDGWNYETKNPHAILGVIAFVLGFVQPIMATFRCDADSSKRPIFNWLHFCVGNVAHIVAVITIFFAVSLEASGLDQGAYWVLSIFVIVHVFFHFLFEVHSWTAGRKKSNEVKMLDMNNGRSMENSTEKNDKSLAGSVFRILLLGIYVIFLLVIVLTLYGLIGVAK